MENAPASGAGKGAGSIRATPKADVELYCVRIDFVMTADREPISEIAAVLHGVQNAESGSPCPTRLHRGISDPPTYMVQLTLVVGGAFTWYRQGEKSAWQVYVRYKDRIYRLEDWKFWSWSIFGEGDTAEIRAHASELRTKVESAAKRMDGVIAEFGRSRVASGEYFVNNNYPKIRSAYEHFKHEMLSAHEEKEKRETSLGKTKSTEEFVKRWNEDAAIGSDIATNGYAMTALYFSSLEVLFDVMFALGPQTINYMEFREQTWAERFKAVLPPSASPEVAGFYEQLLAVKRDIRDKIFHGLGGEESILIHVPSVGLVPISYETIKNSVHFNPTMMDADLVHKALLLFDDFDAWLDMTEPYCRHLGLANFGFPIPLYGKRLQEVKKAMAEVTDFEEWLEKQAMIDDYRREQHYNG